VALRTPTNNNSSSSSNSWASLVVMVTPGGSLASTSILSSTVVRAGALAAATPSARQRHFKSCQQKLEANLVHWIVVALFMACQRFASSLPLIGRLTGLVGANERLLLAYALVLVWLQLPIGAVQLAHDHLVPYMEKKLLGASGKGLFRPTTAVKAKRQNQPQPAAENVEERTTAQLSGVLKMLMYSGVLSRESANAITEVRWKHAVFVWLPFIVLGLLFVVCALQ
jgi:hypothetical protein